MFGEAKRVNPNSYGWCVTQPGIKSRCLNPTAVILVIIILVIIQHIIVDVFVFSELGNNGQHSVSLIA